MKLTCIKSNVGEETSKRLQNLTSNIGHCITHRFQRPNANRFPCTSSQNSIHGLNDWVIGVFTLRLNSSMTPNILSICP